MLDFTTKYLFDLIKKEAQWKILNSDQKKFCEYVLDGHNVFLTGLAGSGKSTASSFLFDFLEKNDVIVGRTATTGVAALNIGGSTLHSYAGLGLADTDFKHILSGVFRNKKAVARLRNIDVLFVDEVSMMQPYLLDILIRVVKAVRGRKHLQYIFSGDFHQLPPVSRENPDESGITFIFESERWRELNFQSVLLSKNIRQKEGSVFAKLLNELRDGNTSNISLLNQCIDVRLPLKNGIQPIRLLGYNIAVERYNNKVLEGLDGAKYDFFANDAGEKRHRDYFHKNCPAPTHLSLKIGAQVMLLRNLDLEKGLCNGQMGVLTGMENNNPVVQFNNGEKAIITRETWEIKEQIIREELNLDTNKKIKKATYKVVASRKQFPLKLCYAVSIHKSQSCTLPAAYIDLNQCFEYGMAYTALSRVADFDCLSLKPFNEEKIRAHPKCVEFYKELEKTS